MKYTTYILLLQPSLFYFIYLFLEEIVDEAETDCIEEADESFNLR